MRMCELLFENVSVSGALQDFVFSSQEEKFPILSYLQVAVKYSTYHINESSSSISFVSIY